MRRLLNKRGLMKFIRESSLEPEIKRSLSAAWKEGVATQTMIGIFDYFLIPFGLFLGASAQEIGFLVAIPNFAVSISQLVAPRVIMWAKSRLRMLVQGTAFQTVALAVTAGLPFAPVPHKIWWLIGLVTFFRLAGSFVGPAWGSLVSDYLPETMRGVYFGWRSRLMTFAGVIGVVFWGTVLYLAKKISGNVSFAVLFLGATLLRIIAVYLMTRMKDIPMQWRQDQSFTFWMFIRRFRESNFVKFIFYASSVTFATQLGIPYLSVHMLNNLHFNYIQYSMVHISGMLAATISFPIWGRHADSVGNAAVLKLISFIIPIFPFLWMFAHHPATFMLIEATSGFIWGGFGLCTTNFVFDAVSSPKRVRCLSYYNLINGAAIFAGASLGGYLAEHLPPLMGYRVITLFMISGFMRFAADFFLSEHFQEVRVTTKKVKSTNLFFSVLGVRPLIGKGWVWEEEA